MAIQYQFPRFTLGDAVLSGHTTMAPGTIATRQIMDRNLFQFSLPYEHVDHLIKSASLNIQHSAQLIEIYNVFRVAKLLQ